MNAGQQSAALSRKGDNSVTQNLIEYISLIYIIVKRETFVSEIQQNI